MFFVCAGSFFSICFNKLGISLNSTFAVETSFALILFLKACLTNLSSSSPCSNSAIDYTPKISCIVCAEELILALISFIAPTIDLSLVVSLSSITSCFELTSPEMSALESS